MPYYKKKKTSYKPNYNQNNNSYFMFHDIDANKEAILGQVKYWHLENYRYIIPNNNVKPGEINIMNYNKPKIFINGKEFKVNNSEQFVNEFGIAMNPIDCQEFKYSSVSVN